MSRFEELEKVLLTRQIRPTTMRLLVLEELQGQLSALSLTDLEQRMSPVDRITLYRTLKTFEDKGLVHAIDGAGTPKYSLCADACQPSHHQDAHLHFTCDTCGQTTCLPDSQIPTLPIPESFTVASVTVVAKGVCAACRTGT